MHKARIGIYKAVKVTLAIEKLFFDDRIPKNRVVRVKKAVWKALAIDYLIIRKKQ